jgi:hypothetical protein
MGCAQPVEVCRCLWLFVALGHYIIIYIRVHTPNSNGSGLVNCQFYSEPPSDPTAYEAFNIIPLSNYTGRWA